MSSYTFELNGKKFQVKVPQGVSLDQAQALFKQQADTGSLAGVKVGQALSAVTQAAGGMSGALGQLGQQVAGAAGALPAGTNLNSIASSIGSLGQGALAQVSKAQQGVSAAFNSLTTGAGGLAAGLSSSLAAAGFDPATGRSAALESAFASGGLPAAVSSFTGSLGALSSPLTGAAAQVGSLANKAVETMRGAIGAAATNGINVADFAKQAPVLVGIGNMSAADITGTLAQTSKLVGQAADVISNKLGAGKFGLDAPQLEKAGLVKPGTAAAFLAQGANDLVQVLKSPKVWTGKEGVQSLTGFLGNSSLQDKVQQGLMKTGLNELKSLGVPTDKMNPQALGGLATNAAKSVTDTVNWVKNAPGLPANVKAEFDSAATNVAFAINLTQTKIDPPVLQEVKPEPAANTVDAETQNAAAKRLIGNDKVPQVSSSGTNDFAAIFAFRNFVDSTLASFTLLKSRIEQINSEYQKITQEQWNTLNFEAVALRASVKNIITTLNDAALKESDSIPAAGQTYSQKNALRQFNSTLEQFQKLTNLSDEVRILLKALAYKIGPRALDASFDANAFGA